MCNCNVVKYAVSYTHLEEKHLNRWTDAFYKTHWEGRMEEILPGVILDGAHNPGAIEAFAAVSYTHLAVYKRQM